MAPGGYLGVPRAFMSTSPGADAAIDGMSAGARSAAGTDSGSSVRWVLEYAAAGNWGKYDSLEAWWARFVVVRKLWSNPVDQALVGGVVSDRLAYAFAAGYQAAVRALVPSAPGDRIVSFSVTEEEGAHPRAVRTTLREVPGQTGMWRLTGRKRWATLSSTGGLAFVVASTGIGEDGRNRLRVVEVPLDSPGITLRPMPPTPFTPEIGHAEIVLEDVAVPSTAILPGDGYSNYVKPFRTVEDAHVGAAVLGYLLGIAIRYRWPAAVREDLMCLCATARALALGDPKGVETHLGLAGLFRGLGGVMDGAESLWPLVDAETRARWTRDVGLLQVASNARGRRTEAAWKSLGIYP